METIKKSQIITTLLFLACSLTSHAVLFLQPANWVWADLGGHIGYNLLEAVDIDGDGDKELLLGGGGIGFSKGNYVYFMSNDLSTTECLFNLNRPVLDHHISPDQAGQPTILTLVTALHIMQINGRTCEYVFRELLNHYPVQGAGLGDTNNDQIPDLVYSFDNDLYHSSIDDLATQTIKENSGGVKVVVEPLGRPGGDDIGVTRQNVFLFSGADMSQILSLDYAYSDRFDFGDVDGDGSYEVIAAKNNGSGMIAVNVATEQVLFELTTQNYQVVRAMDVDGDGDDEILAGLSQTGAVTVLGENGQVLRSFQNQDHGTVNILYTDLDDDGSAELLWGSGQNSTAPDYFSRVDYETGDLLWRSVNRDGPYRLAKEVIEVNGLPYLTASFARSSSGFSAGHSMVFNQSTGQVQFNELDDHLLAVSSVSAVAAGTLDGADFFETCLAGENSFAIGYVLLCVDGQTGDVIYHRDLPDGIGYPVQMRIMDIDDDQQLDLLMLTHLGILIAYEAPTGFLKWQSPDLIDFSINRDTDIMHLIDDTLWLVHQGQITRVNPSTGAHIDTNNTNFSHLITLGNDIFAFENGVGFGQFNTATQTLSQVLFPTTETHEHIDLSADGQILLLATGTAPEFNTQFITLADGETLWEGDMLFYNTRFIDLYNLYISDQNGVQSLNLKGFVDLIFEDGLEGN